MRELTIEIVNYGDFFTIWLRHNPTGVSTPYGRQWKKRSTAQKHASMIRKFHDERGISSEIVERGGRVR